MRWLPGYRRYHRVSNGHGGDNAWGRWCVVEEPVGLAVVTQIEAHHQAAVIDPLSVDDVRSYARGLVDGGERVTCAAVSMNPGVLAPEVY